MSKTMKTWLIVATSLVAVGCLLCLGALALVKFDVVKLSTVSYETNTYTIEEAYTNVSVITNTADVRFVPSETAQTTVVCYEQKGITHAVDVRDGTLTVAVQDTRKWYERIGVSFDSPAVTVYLPAGVYGDLCVKGNTGCVEIPQSFRFAEIAVKVSTGDVVCGASADNAMTLTTSTGAVTLSNVTCEGEVRVSVSTGRVRVLNVTCAHFTSDGNTGSLTLTNVVSRGKLTARRSTGDVKLEQCDAAELSITTDTGNVTGSLRSSKVFIVNTDTGRVNVPKTIVGGRCEITTDTGHIQMTVPN